MVKRAVGAPNACDRFLWAFKENSTRLMDTEYEDVLRKLEGQSVSLNVDGLSKPLLRLVAHLPDAMEEVSQPQAPVGSDDLDNDSCKVIVVHHLLKRWYQKNVRSITVPTSSGESGAERDLISKYLLRTMELLGLVEGVETSDTFFTHINEKAAQGLQRSDRDTPLTELLSTIIIVDATNRCLHRFFRSLKAKLDRSGWAQDKRSKSRVKGRKEKEGEEESGQEAD